MSRIPEDFRAAVCLQRKAPADQCCHNRGQRITIPPLDQPLASEAQAETPALGNVSWKHEFVLPRALTGMHPLAYTKGADALRHRPNAGRHSMRLPVNAACRSVTNRPLRLLHHESRLSSPRSVEGDGAVIWIVRAGLALGADSIASGRLHDFVRDARRLPTHQMKRQLEEKRRGGTCGDDEQRNAQPTLLRDTQSANPEGRRYALFPSSRPHKHSVPLRSALRRTKGFKKAAGRERCQKPSAGERAEGR